MDKAILIIDDNIQLQELFTMMLQFHGVSNKTIAVSSFEEAMEQNLEKIGLVISDGQFFRNKTLGSLEDLRLEVHAFFKKHGIPVIGISGLQERDEVEFGEFFFKKPIKSFEALIDVVKQCLKL
jgi:DNA-binding NtrC family response regulator